MEFKVSEQIKERGAKLLVADDEPIIRDQLKKIGEMLGFKVHAAGDGEEAWEIFRVVWPDLVILDIHMPRMNGIMLMNKIKEASENSPVILITGYLHFKRVVQKNQIKPDGFIIKPFSVETIVAEIEKLVMEHGLVA